MAARRRSARTRKSAFAVRRWRESKAVRRARAAEIVRRLRELYPEAAAELTYRNPFQFLIAVILSAQTTDVTVNRVTPELFRRYPTPQALAAAPQLEVEEVVRQTGFFRAKARAIRRDLQALGFGRVLYEDTGNIGKGYRRHDEVGTPLCLTVDFQTIEDDDTVTVRDRDTMAQTRLAVAELPAYVREYFAEEAPA